MNDMNELLTNDLSLLNAVVCHKGRNRMRWNTHQYGRWQMHAKYAGGRPDPNAKPLGNSTRDPEKTVTVTAKQNDARYGSGTKPLSDERLERSRAYLERMSRREEWPSAERQRDQERLVRHSKTLFDEKYKTELNRLQTDYQALETQFEAEVTRKNLDFSGIREFNEWTKKNPFEKVSRLYERMNQIRAKEDQVRARMVDDVLNLLPGLDSLSRRYTQLSRSQADLITFVEIAALETGRAT